MVQKYTDFIKIGLLRVPDKDFFETFFGSSLGNGNVQVPERSIIAGTKVGMQKKGCIL